MTSPLCLLRSLADLPKAWIRGRPRISGHSYVEQKEEPDQACCVQILKCEVCQEVHVGWKACTCKRLAQRR